MPFAHSMRVISQLDPHYFHVDARAFVHAEHRRDQNIAARSSR